MVNYYKQLFSSSRQADPTNVLACVPKVIIDEMNTALYCDFVDSEVSAALQQMAPLKAPGPDGMPPLSYQHFWVIVDLDVTSLLGILNNCNP